MGLLSKSHSIWPAGGYFRGVGGMIILGKQKHQATLDCLKLDRKYVEKNGPVRFQITFPFLVRK